MNAWAALGILLTVGGLLLYFMRFSRQAGEDSARAKNQERENEALKEAQDALDAASNRYMRRTVGVILREKYSPGGSRSAPGPVPGAGGKDRPGDEG